MPLDYSDPSTGTTIPAGMKIPSLNETAYTPNILLNGVEPGVSTVTTTPLAPQVYRQKLNSQYNYLGFDHRNSYNSGRSVDCFPVKANVRVSIGHAHCRWKELDDRPCSVKRRVRFEMGVLVFIVME